jgi:transcription elongation factor GreB
MSDKSDSFDDDGPALPTGQPNYMTLLSFNALQAEALALIDVERPEFTRLVQWAASNGDRSENADYHYGKKRLREIDRRIGYIQRRLKLAVVVDPAEQAQRDKVFFGATVTYVLPDGEDKTITIVGVDEANPALGKVSFIAPVARALLGKRVGDEALLHLPDGKVLIEVDAVSYPSPA